MLEEGTRRMEGAESCFGKDGRLLAGPASYPGRLFACFGCLRMTNGESCCHPMHLPDELFALWPDYLLNILAQLNFRETG